MVYPGCQKFFFFPVVCGKNWVATSGRKKPSGHGSYEPHFHAILKQDSLPNRFLVGSVCLRNLTCLHVGQWCVKQRVMLSNWGMANFVSSVSITAVKRLTSVNSVYSVNNFCRVWNVNLLYNIWIWKVQLIRRCPFERAKYSAKLSSECWDFPSTRRALLLPFCAWNVEGNWTNLKSSSRGLVSLKRRLIRRSRSREKWQNGELTWTECKGATKVRRLRAVRPGRSPHLTFIQEFRRNLCWERKKMCYRQNFKSTTT